MTEDRTYKRPESVLVVVYSSDGMILLLQRSDIELLLPVRSLASKEAAIEELSKLNLSTTALEQKSSSRNADLSPDELRHEIRLWSACVEAALQESRFSFPTVLEHFRLDGEKQWVPANQ